MATEPLADSLADPLADLRARAGRVSEVSGHDVRVVLSSPESLTLSIDETLVSGPDPFDEATVHGLELALGAMEQGTLVVTTGDDGLPRVVSADEVPPQ